MFGTLFENGLYLRIMLVMSCVMALMGMVCIPFCMRVVLPETEFQWSRQLSFFIGGKVRRLDRLHIDTMLIQSIGDFVDSWILRDRPSLISLHLSGLCGLSFH